MLPEELTARAVLVGILVWLHDVCIVVHVRVHVHLRPLTCTQTKHANPYKPARPRASLRERAGGWVGGRTDALTHARTRAIAGRESMSATHRWPS